MLPAIDTLDTLGGELENAHAVMDPVTDLDAPADNASRGNVAMLTHTGIRAMRSFVGGVAPADPVEGLVHDAMWLRHTPTLAEVTHFGVGIYDVEWPETVLDELGEEHALNLRAGAAWATGATPYLVQASKLPATNAWRVYVWKFVAGVPTLTDDAAPVTVAVW